MTTFTASAYHDQPKQPHSGVQVKVFRFSSGHDAVAGTVRIGSVNDRILLCKIPSWADVLDMKARVRTRNEDADAHLSLFIARPSLSAALATIATFTCNEALGRIRIEPTVQFAPFRMSTTAVESFAVLCLQWLGDSAASATTSFSIDGHILYATGFHDDRGQG